MYSKYILLLLYMYVHEIMLIYRVYQLLLSHIRAALYLQTILSVYYMRAVNYSCFHKNYKKKYFNKEMGVLHSAMYTDIKIYHNRCLPGLKPVYKYIVVHVCECFYIISYIDMYFVSH